MWLRNPEVVTFLKYRYAVQITHSANVAGALAQSRHCKISTHVDRGRLNNKIPGTKATSFS